MIALKVPIGAPDPARWPLKAVAVIDEEDVHRRLFHEQDWGGLIASQCRSRRPVFIDDRFELFGAKAVLEYVAAIGGGPEWEAIRDRERIDVVWVKPDRGLARRLRNDPAWTIAHSDAASIVFERVETSLDVTEANDGPSPGSRAAATDLGQGAGLAQPPLPRFSKR